MKSLKLKHFSPILLLIAGSLSAADSLPAQDPNPTQQEAVAVPMEALSFFAVAGFKAEPAPAASLAPTGDGSLAFCHNDKWSAACLTGLIIYRCGQYTFPLTPMGCALAAGTFVDSLQMKRIDVEVEGKTYSLPVIFTGILEKLIQDPSTQNDIQSLRYLLVASAKSKSKFDLYEWFRAMANGNFERTLMNLAVLLQDTSAVAIQTNYLKGVAKARGFNAATLKAIEDLEEVLYQLNSEILADEDSRSWLRLYPTAEMDRDTTPLIYHFYPMAFTARILQLTLNGNRLSSFIPFLFNTEYLNQTLDPAAWPLHHPAPFKIDSDWKRWKMRDLYGGYAGSLWGLQKTKSLPGLEKFQTAYASAPYETMRRLFWSMPNP